MAQPGTLGSAARARGSRRSELRVLELLGTVERGGVSSFVAQLVPSLPGFVRVTVVVPKEGECADGLRARGAKVVVFPLDDGHGLGQSVMRTVDLVRTLRIDVIHAHLDNAHAIAALASAVTGVPTFASIHGQAVPVRDLEVMARGWSRLGVVAEVAHAHARFLGARHEQVALVPNGIDVDAFSPGPRGALRRAWGVPDDAPVVGFVGRLAPEKGPADFVHLCGDLAGRHPGAHFLVAGEGPLRSRCEGVARQRRLEGRVHLVGWTADMPALYRELDVLVVSSICEGAPLALLEAMASGVPAVATAVGGVPEIVVDGVCGTLYEVGDSGAGASAVHSFLANSTLRHAAGRAARARVLARFTLRQHVARITDELLRTARRRESRIEDIALAREMRGL